MIPRALSGFRIYIMDGSTKFYLRDWIVCDTKDNLIFDVNSKNSMNLKGMKIATWYRAKMIELGYHPHIESI